MQYIELIRTLTDKLKLLNIHNNSFQSKLQNAIYQGVLRPFIRNIVDTNSSANYSFSHERDVVTELCSKLHELLSLDNSGYWPIIFDKKKKTYSCIEFDLLQTISLLKLPMDFPVNIGDSSIPLSELVAKICERANRFTTEFKGNIPAEVYTIALNVLTNIDLSSNKSLYASSKALIRSLSDRGFNEARSWNTKQIIRLAWSNAIHGLHPDGSFECSLDWEQIKVILNEVNIDVQGGFKLDSVTAKELFQVYAAHYDKIFEFPSELYETMKSYIPSFEANSHGSGFEDDIQKRLTSKAGVLNALKNYEILNKINIDFDNPIDPNIGLETDFRLTHKASGAQLAIQIDGKQYHSFPCFNPDNLRTDKRTQFRDFCFEQTGYKVLRVSDAITMNYDQLLTEGIKNKFLFPAHLSLQQQRMNNLLQARDEVVLKRAEIEKLLNTAIRNCDDSTFAAIQETHLKLSQSIPDELEIAQVPKIKKQLSDSHIACMADLHTLIRNSGSLKEFHEKTPLRIEQLRDLDELLSELNTCIDLYTPFTQIQAKLNDLKQKREMIEENIKVLENRNELNKTKITRLEKDFRAKNTGISNGRKIGKKEEEIQKLVAQQLEIQDKIKILNDENEEITLVYPQHQQLNSDIFAMERLLQKENPGTHIISAALKQTDKINIILSDLNVFLKTHPGVTMDEITSQLDSIELQVSSMQDTLNAAKALEITRQDLINQANSLINFCDTHKIKKLWSLLSLPGEIEESEANDLSNFYDLLKEERKEINTQIQKKNDENEMAEKLKALSLNSNPALESSANQEPIQQQYASYTPGFKTAFNNDESHCPSSATTQSNGFPKGSKLP